jgi:hypothetical protein
MSSARRMLLGLRSQWQLVAGSDYEDNPKHPLYQQQYPAFVPG